ncbi:MAG: TIGR00282 family metallophosphoesterase [bacterium]|nr:TIGR00282 family metallophosphoesterase [bacterium]
MKILYIGDIVARIGRATVQKVLPDLIKEKNIDFVIAQSENMSTGNGLTIKAVEEMREVGIDFFTGGNHSFKKKEFYPYLNDPKIPVIRPANYPENTPGRGWAIASSSFGKILVINLMGITFNGPQLENPLKKVDEILEENKNEKLSASLVNFHGDSTSEKVAVGYYLDSKVSAVIGDHTHVPTADARILPGGTAIITDVGMVGPADSVLGVKKEIIISRWLNQLPARHEITTSGPCQFCAVLINISTKGKAKSIEQIIRLVDI